MKTQFRLIATGLILFIFTEDLSAQMRFKDLVGNPVLTYGDAGEWDDGVIWGAKIIKDGDTLRMWYTGHHGSIWNSDYSHIGYAWSLDGVEWTKHNDPGTTETPYAYSDPVLSADQPWEGGWVSTGPVIKDGDSLKMWYGAMNNGYAISLDGINWIKRQEPVEISTGPDNDWDDGMIGPYTVIKEDDEYTMWYSGSRPDFPWENSFPQVGLATSPDGLTWTKYDDPATQNAPYAYSDPVLKVGSAGEWDSDRAFEPWVMMTDTGYTMFYTGLKGPLNTNVKQQIGLAYSTDGIHWTKDEYNPIIKDDYSVVQWGRSFYNGTALFYDNRFHYWFSPFMIPPYEARPQIGYAVQLTSCHPESFEFTTQAEIDSFQVNCNNCNEVEEYVTINGDDITNLNGLSTLTSIGSILEIGKYDGGCSGLVSLSGLDNLTSVKSITIQRNPALTSITGLSNVTSSIKNLRIIDNDALTNLVGFVGVKTIKLDLAIIDNDVLVNLEGLNNIDSINSIMWAGGRLIIENNDALINLNGLERLTHIGFGAEPSGGIFITNNDALINLNGINNIEASSIQDISITNNPSLATCDIQSICNYLADPNGMVEINENAPGCNSQEEVEEDCDNNCLPGGFSPYLQEDIDNFPSKYLGCSEVEGNVFISSSLITNLDSLYAITTIGGNLSISGCKNLQGLSGFNNITNIAGNLTIRNNESLSMCDADGICKYLTNPNGEINIENNDDGCESTSQVLDSCGIDAVYEHAFANKTTLNPNPFSTSTTIEYELNHTAYVQIFIYNHLGEQIKVIDRKNSAGKHQIAWHTEGLPAGIYFCIIRTKSGTQTMKMIKLK